MKNRERDESMCVGGGGQCGKKEWKAGDKAL